MIKGLLKSVFILGLTLLPISFSNATLINNGYYIWLDLAVKESGNFDGTFVQTNNLVTLGNIGGANFKFMYDTVMYDNIRQIRTNNYNGGYGHYFRNDGNLVFHKRGVSSSTPSVTPNYFVKTTLDSYQSDVLNSVNYTYTLDQIKNETSKIDKLILGIGNGAGSSGNPLVTVYSPIYFCMVNGNNVYCSSCSIGDSGFSPSCVGGQDVYDIGLTDGSTIQDIVDGGKVGSSPFVAGGNNTYQPGDNYTTPTDIDRYIEYYEGRYGRNINMCYVGTNDYTTNYGSGNLSFVEGTGLTLNELYFNLYGTFGNNNIKNVGTFINVWLMNYEQWFYNGKGWIANYNGPDTNVTYNYDNIEYPFLNKPVAIYFMSNNLYDFYRVRDNQGEEMAYYCQIKVNYSYYKENPDKFKEEEDKVDPVYTDRAKTYYNNSVNNNGSGKVGFQVPDLTGTVWGDVSSGNVLPEDLNPTNLFKDFFTKVTNLTKVYSPARNGILPDWIVYPLIFLVLFRIFKH